MPIDRTPRQHVNVPSNCVLRYANEETNIVGLCSLEYDTAPGFTIARSELKCQTLLTDLERRVEERARLNRLVEKQHRRLQGDERAARTHHEMECIRQNTELDRYEKREEHRSVMRKFTVEGKVERRFKTQMDNLQKKRTDNAFANQSGLDELHNRGLDIAEDYNCRVKNWERSTPRALKCPSFKDPDVKPRPVKTPDKPVRPSVPKELTQEEESALAGLGSFADGVVAVSPADQRKTSEKHAEGHFHVPRKSLMKWLLTEDPTRPLPAPIPPGARPDHTPRVIIQSCFPPEYSPSSG
jgi:hypothetical protein